MRHGQAILIIVSAIASTSCYRVAIVSGRPESSEYPPLNESNHGGFVNGIAEDGTIRLSAICKNGWATAHVKTGFLNGLANAFYGLIYHAQDVTLKCAPDNPGPSAPGAETRPIAPPGS